MQGVVCNTLTGCLVISAYAPCPDITATVTPDLKCSNGCGNPMLASFLAFTCICITAVFGLAGLFCYGK